MQIVPRIDDVDGIDLDDLFYTDDEVATMKYNAFMAECGLVDEAEEESVPEETSDKVTSFHSNGVDVECSFENIGALESSLPISKSISRRTFFDETIHPLSPKIYRRRKSHTTECRSGPKHPQKKIQVDAPKVVASSWRRPLRTTPAQLLLSRAA